MLEPEEAAFMADKGLDVTDMLGHVMYYVDFVDRLGGERFVEQQLDLTSITHEADAVGTSDAVVIKDDTLYVVDLKYGMGLRLTRRTIHKSRFTPARLITLMNALLTSRKST
jgi:Protein of unknown function (DUF2800).